MTVDFEHHMRTGAMKVCIDDALVLDRPLEARLVARRSAGCRCRTGHASRPSRCRRSVMPCASEVACDGKVRTPRSTATIRPDSSRTLHVEVLRALDDLTLEWR